MHSFYSWVISDCTYIPQFLYPFICQWTSRLLLCPMLCYAKSLQSCPTVCDPIDSSPTGSLSLGFSRQEHWSGLPFPSPMHGSEVAQSCPTLSNPMDCSLPGSSVPGIFQARVLEWDAIAFSKHEPRANQSIIQFTDVYCSPVVHASCPVVNGRI